MLFSWVASIFRYEAILTLFWVAIGGIIIGIIVLLVYLVHEQKKVKQYEITVVKVPMDEGLQQELQEHKQAVKKLSQVIEETREHHGEQVLRNNLT